MKFKSFIILSIGLILLLNSCVSKKYIRPDYVTATTAYRNSELDTNNIASIAWNDYYGDSNLVFLIQTALDSNPDIQQAASNIRAAEEYFKQSKAAFFPTIGASVSAQVAPSYQDGTLTGVGTYSFMLETVSNGSMVSWEIDIWGKLAAAKRSQKAQLMQSQAYYNAVKTQLVASIASAYYSLMALDAELLIYQTSAETRQESLNILKDLKAAAQTNEIAVNQGAAQLYFVLATIPQIKIQIQTTENLISTLIGTAPQKIERSSFLNSSNVEAEILTVGVPAQLLSMRPDVMAAEYALISAHEQWNYARASLYPSLVISAGVGASSNSFSNWFALPQNLVGNLLGGITAPIFYNRKLKTQKNVAEENKLQAALNFKNTLLTAQREVSDAIVTYQFSNESISYQIKQTEELNKAVSGSFEMLKGGFASYLDLLYAEDNALNSSINLIQYYLQKSNARVELYRALGGGWN